MRLSARFRLALYAAFTALVATGIGWVAADRLKDTPDGEMWQQLSSYLLMLHGGAAMGVQLLLGALAPLHLQRAWRARRNRVAGSIIVAVNAVLIASAFGLYYLGSEALRPWISDVHIAAGLALPLLLAIHVWLGRRSRPRTSREAMRQA